MFATAFGSDKDLVVVAETYWFERFNVYLNIINTEEGRKE
jgi:hypothetical protein